jgi:cytochrome c oxidase subunit 3
MAGKANHDYHILEPDIWPLVGSLSALTFTSGMVLSWHPDLFGNSAAIVMWAALRA